MKIYISLPISQNPQKAREKADLIKASLSRKGYEVVNPFDVFAGDKPKYEDFICYDLLAMLDCDAIFFCQGWEQSCGCCIEHDVAQRYNAFGKKSFKLIYE